MIRTSEWVSIGHPDKIADYISCALLDEYIAADDATRYAVEVMIKDNVVTLGGEVTSKALFSDEKIASIVRKAVNGIGYTREYQEKWGKENTICGDELLVHLNIGKQSPDISQGVTSDGWGDQGIFWGMAVDQPENGFMPEDYFLAREVGKALYKSGMGGLDIKTQVTMNEDKVENVTVAIPLQDNHCSYKKVHAVVKGMTECDNVTINGTGRYVRHSSIADCGVTGRKLVVDQYGGNCPIGGGAPWTKDGSKADLTLTLHARNLALDFMKKEGVPKVYCSISCSIGSPVIQIAYMDAIGRELRHEEAIARPSSLIARYGLNKPAYAQLCREGLFHGIH